MVCPDSLDCISLLVIFSVLSYIFLHQMAFATYILFAFLSFRSFHFIDFSDCNFAEIEFPPNNATIIFVHLSRLLLFLFFDFAVECVCVHRFPCREFDRVVVVCRAPIDSQ